MTNDELVQHLKEAQALIAKQAARIAELEARLAELEQKLDEAQRRGKRQATPFSKGSPKPQPKTPGRKGGHPAAHRPKPERITRIVEAPLPSHCPACGGTVIEETVHAQYQEDIPRPIETLITQFNVHVGRCANCATRLQGRHAEQTSDALGSAAVQLGPTVLGLAAELKHDLGVSYGKVARFFRLTFGLGANASSFARADQRLAQEFAPTYADLQTQLRQSAVAHVDETGWKVGGIPRGCGSLQMTTSRSTPLIRIAIIGWSNASSGKRLPESSSPIAFSPMIR
jgi:transposase